MTSLHLADLIGNLWRKDLPKTHWDQAARNLVKGEIRKRMDIAVEDFEGEFEEYARDGAAFDRAIAAHVSKKTAECLDGEPEIAALVELEGDDAGHNHLAAAIARLHDKGLTSELLAALGEKYPDVLRAKFPDGIPAAQAETAKLRTDSDIDRAMARQREKIRWLAEAMTLVQQQPDLSDAAIARVVRRHPSALTRNPTYQTAAKLAREHAPPPPGKKDAEGNLEAVQEDREGDSENE